MMRLAIMQPYFLPYIGYFQWMPAVNRFMLLDDVNFNQWRGSTAIESPSMARFSG
jgi:hypothetical protein